MFRKFELSNAAVNDKVYSNGGVFGVVVHCTPYYVVIDWDNGSTTSTHISSDHAILARSIARLGDTRLYRGDTIYEGKRPLIIDDVVNAEGKILRFKNGTVAALHNGTYLDANLFSLQLNAPTIVLNGVVIPAPVEGRVEEGTHLYCPSFIRLDSHILIFFSSGNSKHRLLLKKGLLWGTPEGAIAYINATVGDNDVS